MVLVTLTKQHHTHSAIAGLLAGSLVLLTGATGFTGQHLAARLVGMGARVRAVARFTSNTRPLEHLPIEWHRGDLHDADFIQHAAVGVNYVMHLASSYRETFSSRRVQYDVHVNGTKRLAEAAAEQPDFRRFIHVSTVGVHGHIEEPPANETYRFSPGDDYQETKLEAEQWIMDHGRASGLPVVVVRPAAIYGPGETRLLKLFRMASCKVVPLIGNGRCMYHLIHVNDLVDFMSHAAVHPKAIHEAFICGSHEPISLEELVATAGRCFGVRNRFVRLPDGPIMALARMCNFICSPLKIRPPLHPRRVAFFTKDRAFDTSKMRDLVGFQPKVENRAGIEQTAHWYLRNGWVIIPQAGRKALPSVTG